MTSDSGIAILPWVVRNLVLGFWCDGLVSVWVCFSWLVLGFVVGIWLAGSGGVCVGGWFAGGFGLLLVFVVGAGFGSFTRV